MLGVQLRHLVRLLPCVQRRIGAIRTWRVKDYKFNRAVGSTAAWRKHMGVDLASSYGWANEYTTPEYRLKMAIRSGDEDAVARQISRGVNVDVFLKYGTTALMDAARKGNINIVRQLLNAGARINLINNYDPNCIDGGSY